jgi:RimJ/RimL family protein N-acetyltransferase
MNAPALREAINVDCGTASLHAFPTHRIAREVLSDGTLVSIRPIRAADKKIELEFLRGLSRQTRYQRLLSMRDLLPGELERLTDIDYDHEMALIATIRANDDGTESEIGVARYVRDADEGGGAEFAIVIGDCWQRRGLGHKLLTNLIATARDAGVRKLTGITLSTNLAMLRLAKKLGFALRYHPGDASLMRVTLTL